VSQETARFTRDAEVLREVAEACERRMAIVQRLIEALQT
jgi:hypothetical protein